MAMYSRQLSATFHATRATAVATTPSSALASSYHPNYTPAAVSVWYGKLNTPVSHGRAAVVNHSDEDADSTILGHNSLDSNGDVEQTLLLLDVQHSVDFSPSIEKHPEHLPDGYMIDDSCFPAVSIVELEDASQKQMRDLQIGDRVKVSPSRYSGMHMTSHRDRDASDRHYRQLSAGSAHNYSGTPYQNYPTARPI